MLTLIDREIRDNSLCVALPCLIGIGIIGFAIFVAFYATMGSSEILLASSGILMPVLLVGFCGLGASQMYSDRANRISSLLATQGVTRSRILAARVLVGVGTVLASLVPPAVTILILLWAFLPPLSFYGRMVVEIFTVAILAGVAGYCVGLLVSWTTSKAWLVMGNLLLLSLVTSLVWIKGFGPDVMAILLLFIVAALTRVWHVYTSASL